MGLPAAFLLPAAALWLTNLGLGNSVTPDVCARWNANLPECTLDGRSLSPIHHCRWCTTYVYCWGGCKALGSGGVNIGLRIRSDRKMGNQSNLPAFVKGSPVSLHSDGFLQQQRWWQPSQPASQPNNHPPASQARHRQEKEGLGFFSYRELLLITLFCV